MTIRLADLEEELEPVLLPDGSEQRIKRFDGGTAQLYGLWAAQPEEQRDGQILWQVARRCLPDATDEQVEGLTIAQASAVVAHAAGQVDAVLADLKNANGAEPEETTTSEESSAPRTPSARSSSPSPASPVEAPPT